MFDVPANRHGVEAPQPGRRVLPRAARAVPERGEGGARRNGRSCPRTTRSSPPRRVAAGSSWSETPRGAVIRSRRPASPRPRATPSTSSRRCARRRRPAACGATRRSRGTAAHARGACRVALPGVQRPDARDAAPARRDPPVLERSRRGRAARWRCLSTHEGRMSMMALCYAHAVGYAMTELVRRRGAVAGAPRWRPGAGWPPLCRATPRRVPGPSASRGSRERMPA